MLLSAVKKSVLTGLLLCAVKITMHPILFFHGPAREITDLRPLLLHWQYCYYTGFVLHCIKIVWVHKQPKHFDHEQTWQR